LAAHGAFGGGKPSMPKPTAAPSTPKPTAAPARWNKSAAGAILHNCSLNAPRLVAADAERVNAATEEAFFA
jgi:hypothetical protein